MKPLNFDQRNHVKKTDNYKSETFTNMDLPVLNTEIEGEEISQSIWDLSDEEIKDVLKHKKIVLHVWGYKYPPVGLTVFNDENAENINITE